MARVATAGGRLRQIDNIKFESIYSEKDAIKYEELRIGDMSFADIEPFLHKLPPREIDLVTLYRKYGKNQKDIAKMFSVTQGAVSSRLRRAADRLQFLRDLPKITDAEIETGLAKVFDDPIEIEIIKCMKETTCQSRTAVLINKKFNLVSDKEKMTQVKVRHRFEKCLARLKVLKDSDPKYRRFYDFLFFIKNNLYALHEVHLPHFDRGPYAIFSLKT
jgi:predicted transcriptional regulator